jgi:hypothetical protein
MSARPESWSPPASPTLAPVAALVAAGIFFLSWGLLHYGFYTRHLLIDTPVYERYGDAMADGQVPYRDFAVEYPPAALPAFVVPSLFAAPGDLPAYRRVFETLMALCGAALAALVVLVLAGSRAPPRELGLGVALVGFAPLALGPLVLSRFDLWPAALTAGALAAFVAGRERLGLGVLGVAVGAKLYPAVLLPLLVVSLARRRGRRAAVEGAAAFAALVTLCYLPFVALSPGGVWHSISVQASRPLQIESLGAAILLAAHQAFGLSITMSSGHGSQNLVGDAADLLAALQTAAIVVALVGIWWAFLRGPASRERLLRLGAAAVCAFVALGKVLSPQFLIWLIPLVPLVRGRRGAAAAGLFLAALILTQLWFPYRYWNLALEFEPRSSWLVFGRDLVLLALLAVLVWPTRAPGRAQPGGTRP